MKKNILVILAEGFEEVEAVTPIDLLRRCEANVITAGLGTDNVVSGHGITFKTDVIFEENADLPDAIIFPGGQPGAENLKNSVKVLDLITKMNDKKKLIAAICASPALVLAPTGILNGKKATCYPGLEKSFAPGVRFVKEDVVKDGNIITSRGPGTAFAFSIRIAEEIVGREKARMVAEQMLYIK
jgi:4-methyl-5(b-hydroxyethyl)-thiazole monophosphate biosynthesis